MLYLSLNRCNRVLNMSEIQMRIYIFLFRLDTLSIYNEFI